ncbi:MAG: T9SS type A sorting domain-containing protein [Bacteroidota bacterium]
MKAIFQRLTLLFVVSFFILYQTTEAQPGCTDPQAINFDPSATENDGTCEYPTTTYSLEQVANLSANLAEASGLAFFENRLFTHLDGGNPDQLYEIDTLNGSIKQTFTIPLADNLDWEDLAEDEEHLYIGDFGNNFGNRTDLRIYKILKSDFLSGTISPELIEFSYSDQTDFTSLPNNNDYDCEAFFFWNDSLHLFSKNWVNLKTRHYVLPVTPGQHTAQLRDSLDADGLITAADISTDGSAVLIGYNTANAPLVEAFLWLLFDFNGSQILSGNKRRISLGSVAFTSQLEGITFRDSTSGFICAEEFSVLPPKLMEFDISQWLGNPVPAFEAFDQSSIKIFPNPAQEIIQINFTTPPTHTPHVQIIDSGGRKVLERFLKNSFPVTETSLNISHFPPGAYWIFIHYENQFLTKLIHKQ